MLRTAGAIVEGFAYWNGRQKIVGEVFEKASARALYDDLVGKRRDPGLLEQTGEGSFAFNVFPIEPREKKRVQVRFGQRLSRMGASAGAFDCRDLVRFVRRIRPGGGTNIAAALSAALDAQNGGHEPHIVLFLTDGQSDRAFDAGLCVLEAGRFRAVAAPFRMVNDLHVTPQGLWVAAAEGLYFIADGRSFRRESRVRERGANRIARSSRSLFVTTPFALYALAAPRPSPHRSALGERSKGWTAPHCPTRTSTPSCARPGASGSAPNPASHSSTRHERRLNFFFFSTRPRGAAA